MDNTLCFLTSLLFIFLFLSSGGRSQINFRETESPKSQFTTNGGGGRAINVDQGGVRVNIIFDEGPSNLQNDPPTCLTPDQRPGFCKSLAECAVFFAEIPNLVERPCATANGQEGVCCPARAGQVKAPRPGVSSSGVLAPPPPPNVVVPRVSQEQLFTVVDNSIQSFNRRQNNANKILFQDRIQVPQNSPAAKHQRFFTSTNEILDKGNDAQMNIEASVGLVNDLRLSKLQGTFALPHISTRNTPIANTCPAESRCNPNYPYRTIDGSCNNLQHTDWGKAGTAFQRILPPKYGDGVSSPRTVGTRGIRLPSPRQISSSFIPDENRPYNNITLILMQWGQFLDHDLTHTPIVKGVNQTSISCCSNGQFLQAQFQHPDCFPIEIPRNDPFFNRFGLECMDFVRSLPAPRRDCNFGPREQMSQITSYIDGSNVYGSNDGKSQSLREGKNGLLRGQRVTRGKRELLPASPGECSDKEGRRFCFSAGDVRVNEQIDLAVIHTVWLREHNRIAGILKSINPNWNDEITFQETRRIIIAEMQHITYNEFLPLVLGPAYMRTFSLAPVQKGHTTLYDRTVEPSITNVFASAAFRFGHSLVQGIIEGVNRFGTVSQAFSLSQTQFQPFPVYDNFDSFVRGMASQECQRFDNFLSQSLTKHLFQGSSQFGLDLGAINIQRGRDHGIPPYNDWREICGLPRVVSWNELNEIMSPQSVSNLERLYDSVDDIDLFVGAIGELPLKDAILGPVFVCLVGDQFARLRRGDRFYYEEKTSRFTEAQLDQIRKVSLARVLCDNSDDITVIQPLVMQKASVLNRRLPCNEAAIPAIDFSFWREFKPNQNFGGQNRNPQLQQPTRSDAIFGRPAGPPPDPVRPSNADRPPTQFNLSQNPRPQFVPATPPSSFTNFPSRNTNNNNVRPSTSNFVSNSNSDSNFVLTSNSNFIRPDNNGRNLPPITISIGNPTNNNNIPPGPVRVSLSRGDSSSNFGNPFVGTQQQFQLQNQRFNGGRVQNFGK